jgi:hypothetical protein
LAQRLRVIKQFRYFHSEEAKMRKFGLTLAAAGVSLVGMTSAQAAPITGSVTLADGITAASLTNLPTSIVGLLTIFSSRTPRVLPVAQ